MSFDAALTTMSFKVIMLLSINNLIYCSINNNTDHLLNDNCESNEDCANSNAYCEPNFGKCVCSGDYFADIRLNRCIKHKVLGERCDADVECARINAYCDRNLCACKPGSIPVGDRFDRCSESYTVFGRKKYGQICKTLECDFESKLICFKGSCDCHVGYAHQNGFCVKSPNHFRMYKNSNSNNLNNYRGRSGDELDDDLSFSRDKTLFDYIVIILATLIFLISMCGAIGYLLRDKDNSNQNSTNFNSPRNDHYFLNSATMATEANHSSDIPPSTQLALQRLQLRQEINRALTANSSDYQRISFTNNHNDQPPSYQEATRFSKFRKRFSLF